jgi:hypothetical protein
MVNFGSLVVRLRELREDERFKGGS